MSETYVECLVKGHASMGAKILKIVLIVLTVLFVVSMVVTGIIGFIFALAAGAGVYFANLFSDVEFEYLYIDKEITVDQVLGKSKRKRVATYQVDRMEIFAPAKSYHLDDFKNRQVKVKDYSSAEPQDEGRCFAMYYEGGEKILFTPNEEMVKALRNVAPRKVFKD